MERRGESGLGGRSFFYGAFLLNVVLCRAFLEIRDHSQAWESVLQHLQSGISSLIPPAQ